MSEEPRQIGAQTDLPLTAQGRQQIEKGALALQKANYTPSAIYAGPLKRQRESAQILAAPFSLPVTSSEALREIDYGLWEGLKAPEIESKWGKEYQAWREKGEWPEMIFRGNLNQHLQQIQQWLFSLDSPDSSDHFILAVTSNGLLRFFHPEWRQIGKRGEMDRLKVKTGHFCELILSHPVQVVRWNEPF